MMRHSLNLSFTWSCNNQIQFIVYLVQNCLLQSSSYDTDNIKRDIILILVSVSVAALFHFNLVQKEIIKMVKLLLAFLSCLLLLLLIAADGAIASICPPVDAYAPCDCMDYNPGIYLLCFNRNLTDSKVSAILDAFLTTPGVSPVDYLDLSGNLLTRVPNQIKSFTHLGVVHLKKNAITSIESGDFDFQSTVNPLQNLILENNQITTIAPGAFKSN